jgi:hypothetical protein
LSHARVAATILAPFSRHANSLEHRMSQFPDRLETEHLFDVDVDLHEPERFGDTPFGGRAVFIVRDGTVSGPRLRARVRPGGGDWFLVRGDGVGELDVRATLETDDGALILMIYRGILDAPPDVAARAVAGEDVPPSSYYFRTAPRFETAAPQYAWLNKLICVAYGWFGQNRVAYRVFAIR